MLLFDNATSTFLTDERERDGHGREVVKQKLMVVFLYCLVGNTLLLKYAQREEWCSVRLVGHHICWRP